MLNCSNEPFSCGRQRVTLNKSVFSSQYLSNNSILAENTKFQILALIHDTYVTSCTLYSAHKMTHIILRTIYTIHVIQYKNIAVSM